MRAILGTTLVAMLVAVSAGAATPTDSGKPAVLAPHDAGPAETTGQKAYRNAYISKTVKKEQEVTKERAWTPDIGATENLHWKRAYKALRIRELAEDDKETSAITRVDAYITKLDQHFFTELTTLAAEAPALLPAPALTAPAKGSSLGVGTAVSIKIAPVAGATHYYCLLWGKEHHMWSNYDPATKQFGATPECTIPAGDAKWAKFESGGANIQIRAEIPEKTKKGVAFNMWTHTAQIPVTITGGAAPAASGAK